MLPDLVAFDFAGVVAAAGYPGTTVIPALNWLLSLLALKLTSISFGERGSRQLWNYGSRQRLAVCSYPELWMVLYSYTTSLSRDHQLHQFVLYECLSHWQDPFSRAGLGHLQYLSIPQGVSLDQVDTDDRTILVNCPVPMMQRAHDAPESLRPRRGSPAFPRPCAEVR